MRVAVIVLIVLGLVPCVLAAPATAPSTNPAAEQSTPKAALKAFARALDAGDRARVLSLLQADSEQEKKLANATATKKARLAYCAVSSSIAAA